MYIKFFWSFTCSIILLPYLLAILFPIDFLLYLLLFTIATIATRLSISPEPANILAIRDHLRHLVIGHHMYLIGLLYFSISLHIFLN